MSFKYTWNRRWNGWDAVHEMTQLEKGPWLKASHNKSCLTLSMESGTVVESSALVLVISVLSVCFFCAAVSQNCKWILRNLTRWQKGYERADWQPPDYSRSHKEIDTDLSERKASRWGKICPGIWDRTQNQCPSDAVTLPTELGRCHLRGSWLA